MLSFLIFRNYLLSRRSGALVRIIAWHCILGVGMGVAALLIVLSVMNGFNLTIRSRMLNLEPHLVVPSKTRPTDAEMKGLQNRLKDLAQVERVDRYESHDFILRTQDGAFGSAIAKGYDQDSLQSLLKRVKGATSKGRTDEAPPFEALGPGELILGVDLARGLGLFEGDDVLLVPPETLLLPKGEIPRLGRFKVQSLLNSQVQDIDSKVLFYQLQPSGQKNARIQTLSLETGYEVRLLDPYKASMVKVKLADMGIASQTWMERDNSLFYSLKMESFLMQLFLTLAVLITSFSIVTIMVLLMNQKRKDIGLLQAMGLSLKRTRAVFFRVGMLLSFVGITGGVVIGTVVSLMLDWYPMELLPDIYTDSTLPAKLTLKIFFFVVGSSSIIAILGSWLPVWRYVMRHPSENLRKPVGVDF